MKEEDLALSIITYLENKGYESYKEVSLKGRGGNIRTDCYFVKDNHTIAVETKCSMTLKVLEQSYRWKSYASQIYVCVPYPKYKERKSRKFILEICQKMNIGVFYVQNNQIFEQFTPSINEKFTYPKLYEQQKQSIAGNANGEFYTSFKNTVNNIKLFMMDKDIYSYDTMITEIEHHYKNNNSAKSSIKKMIERNIIKDFIIINKDNSLFIKKS